MSDMCLIPSVSLLFGRHGRTHTTPSHNYPFAAERVAAALREWDPIVILAVDLDSAAPFTAPQIKSNKPRTNIDCVKKLGIHQGITSGMDLKQQPTPAEIICNVRTSFVNHWNHEWIFMDRKKKNKWNGCCSTMMDKMLHSILLFHYFYFIWDCDIKMD